MSPITASVAAGAAAGPPGTLNTEEALAGEVSGAGTMLNGMELDEDAVRDQQMLEQVASMVKEKPRRRRQSRETVDEQSRDGFRVSGFRVQGRQDPES